MPMDLANPVWQREPFHGPRVDESEQVANEVDCWCVFVFRNCFTTKYINWLYVILCSEVLQIKTWYPFRTCWRDEYVSNQFQKHTASSSQCRSLMWKETATSRHAPVLQHIRHGKHVNAGKFLEFCGEIREFKNSFAATLVSAAKAIKWYISP